MKKAAALIVAIALAALFPACAKKEEPRSLGVAAQVALKEVATLKTVAAAEAFAAAHKFPSSKQTTDVMRAQAEQIPSSAIGASGRLWLTVFLDDAEAIAHVYFYHDKGGHVISTIIHIESVNKP